MKLIKNAICYRMTLPVLPLLEGHLSELRHTEIHEAEREKVGFVPTKDSPNKLVRVHTLRAGTSTMVEGDLVEAVLDLQRCKIEEAKGIQRLPLGDSDDGAEPDVD